MAGTHPITPDMAVRLGHFCGNGAQLWLATLPDDGPSGFFFRDRKPIPW